MVKKYATVVFKNSTTGYTFMHDIEDLAIGEHVVCDTAQGLSLGQVTSTNPSRRAIECATKWIVQCVDMSSHVQRMERIAADKRAQQEIANERKRLTTALAHRQKELVEIVTQTDFEATQIIKRLKELGHDF